jgi:hypothetical protein
LKIVLQMNEKSNRDITAAAFASPGGKGDH